MSQAYPNAAAFRQALEARLRNAAQQRSVQIQGLRLKVAIERLLARLFHDPDPPWLLKGGYAMELRFRPRARTTRDVDLTLGDAVDPGAMTERLLEVHEALQSAAALELGDYFEFIVEPARRELQAAPGGGGRFATLAKMGGRDFARFHIDVGFGDILVGEPERLTGDDLMEFAGFEPTRALAISKAQQFAEKIHAYTVPWTDRENTRSRDLVDLLVLIERGGLDHDAVRFALVQTFRGRACHSLPGHLTPPPEKWRGEFISMANEAGVSATGVDAAFEVLVEYWNQLEPFDRPASWPPPLIR